MIIERNPLSHRVGSWNRDSPTPLAADECAPHHLVRGGGHGTLAARLGERGWGVPIPTRGHTLWCSMYISTICTLIYTVHFNGTGAIPTTHLSLPSTCREEILREGEKSGGNSSYASMGGGREWKSFPSIKRKCWSSSCSFCTYVLGPHINEPTWKITFIREIAPHCYGARMQM